jgi:putative ABC transport system permease protein
MRRVVDAAGSPQSATARTMAASAIIALLMAAIGTYGVMAYTVAQRTHEIGVRVALGAQTADVVRLVLRQASLLVGLGLVLGVGGALAMGVGLKAVLFETNPADPLTIALTALTLAAIAALATWLPARRAARVDPMVALRHD